MPWDAIDLPKSYYSFKIKIQEFFRTCIKTVYNSLHIQLISTTDVAIRLSKMIGLQDVLSYYRNTLEKMK